VIPGVAIASVAAFVAALWWSGVLESAGRAITAARDTAGVMRDATLDDLQRERAAQQASLVLLALCASIVGRSLLALAASAVPIVAADWSGLASSGDVIAFLSRVDVIVVASAVMVVGYLARRRLWPSS